MKSVLLRTLLGLIWIMLGEAPLRPPGDEGHDGDEGMAMTTTMGMLVMTNKTTSRCAERNAAAVVNGFQRNINGLGISRKLL